MKNPREYLTDVELESLILEIEKKELVMGPPELPNQILEALEERRTSDKVIEYKRYRFQVLTTVAAAVLIVFLLPRFEDLQQQKDDFVKPLLKRESVMQSRYETKEEALKDSGILKTMLGGVNIFADDSRFKLFKE